LPPVSAAPARLRPALLLTAALAALWIAQFRPFVFPNNDFYSFRRAAWSFSRGELPPSTKRGPILPAAIAMLAPAMPGEQPELAAALAINLACSLVLFVALVAFAAKTFPAAALPAPRALPDAAALFAILLATTPVLHAAALQPLLEPTLGLFVALAFLGLRARSAWQYAAAACAALSRPDAITLVAILAAANALADRRFVRHAALAAAAAVPCLAWYSLGRRGGGATYLALREAYGGGAPLYLVILPKELFAGWWRADPLSIAGLVATVGIAARGAWRAWRTAPREAGAMLAWFAVSCAVVVLYGVGKTRYVHPIAWVPLLCFAIGVVDLAPRVAARLDGVSRRTHLAVRLAALLAFAVATLLAFAALATVESGAPTAPDVLFAALIPVAWALAIETPPSLRRGTAATAAFVALALAMPLAIGGLARKRELVAAIHDFDRAAVAAAEWVRTRLPAGDRIAALHYSQIKFAAKPAADRVVPFRRFDGATTDELRAALAGEGVRYVAYTWRRPPETRSERFYAERRKEALAAAFASGGPVPGFEHVATLPAEPRLRQPPAQIYRIAED
jgi:hypothetical protein